MRLTLRYDAKDNHRQSDYICTLLLLFALSMLLFGFLNSTPLQIVHGLWRIVVEPDGLITDYMSIATVGGAFVNGGIVMMLSTLLLRFLRLPFTGMSISCCFLMGGFALFGKNPINILPILLGTWLYSLYQRENFAKYIYVALFGTTLSPIVTELGLMCGDWPHGIRIAFPVLMGVVIGFILPPISAYTLRVHQGYNLYNVGFAAGLVGAIVVSLMRSFGNAIEARTIWSRGNNLILGIYLFAMFGLMILAGWWINGRSLRGLWHLTRHSGRAIADFIVLDGCPVTLVNMGLVGMFATLYILAVGGDLNGPTLGGILTIAGFGAFGKHMKNILPVMLGVVLSSMAMVWQLNDPNVQLAALFSTGLAPIAGHFGPLWGIVAGAVHASMVLNVGDLYGGLNLYNNGFSAGLVCIVLVPLIQGLKREDSE